VNEVVASGGWCAPREAVYDLGMKFEPSDVFAMPRIEVDRGGLLYRDLTPEETAAREAWRARVARVTSRLAEARNAAIDRACEIALANGWDIHVYEPPEPLSVSSTTERDLIRLRAVGIEFTPAKHPVPTVHHHRYRDDFYDEDY
jgi:hypothetical protein